MHYIFRNPDHTIHVPKKYFIVSDLHLEFRQGQEKEHWEAFPEHKEAKICLCAGDLTLVKLPEYYKHFTQLCSRFEKVLFVPGNHEYYGSNPTDVTSRLDGVERLLAPVLKILRTGDPYMYEGQRFIGDTMWFPDKPEVHIYRRMINDSVQIKGLFPWAFTQSNLFMVWMRGNIQEDDIVITHHVPNNVDTRPLWRNSPTQAYFVNSDCDRYFSNPNTIKPKAWIYGHTHDKHDYHIGRTRFICNPVGYCGENHYLPEAAEPAVYEI